MIYIFLSNALEQARLVSSLLYSILLIWHSAQTSGQLNSKDFRRVMTQATQKEQALKKKIIDIFRTFYQRKLRLSFLDWEPKSGDSIHHTVLSSATGLESPKSLASDRASFLDSFSPISQVAFTSPPLLGVWISWWNSLSIVLDTLLHKHWCPCVKGYQKRPLRFVCRSYLSNVFVSLFEARRIRSKYIFQIIGFSPLLYISTKVTLSCHFSYDHRLLEVHCQRCVSKVRLSAVSACSVQSCAAGTVQCGVVLIHWVSGYLRVINTSIC